ncbi:DUF4097 family beta strand repeat-containing protein [Stenotrophomonas sp. YIM B06876]|uniref:DUF4097 family beta strand repeat-containing protein n=1 Tax=Stenotrophomonas sp. YIM B06876 TaxID=3060211 RepID=UPI002738E64D|nr:DUF4097 family beta strand repeat-containing protein [Stenotrophomonas sp. YIM B06876]
MHLKLACCALLLLPASAFAAPQCKHSQPKALDLDLAGAKAVVFEVNSHDLHLTATPGAPAHLSGRACASTTDLLAKLTVSQQRVGDKLVVQLKRESKGLSLDFGSSYAYLDISGTLPDTILVQLKVGSGDATLAGAGSMSADVGSGDVTARNIKGPVTAAVGSGDIDFTDIGPLHVLSIGSGDVKVDGVRGAAKIGSVGSGDLKLRNVQGDVAIDSLGSGDIEVATVRGNVTLGSIGSGDFDVRNAGGNLTVGRSGSGSIRHAGVGGTVELPRKR